MNKIVMEAYAKINLGLNVIGKRKDGYHELKTIMQEVDLKDKLIIEDRKRGIKISSNHGELPLDESNLVYKAWEEMKKFSGVERGVDIHIEKKIPIGGGLAGGSSNGAAVLKALNRLWKLDLGGEKLEEIGARIGSDVPFFIRGGTALGEGRGTELSKLTSLGGKDIILVNPNMNFSTIEAYRDLEIKGENGKIDRMVKLIEDEDLEGLSKLLHNDLEEKAIEKHPIIAEIKEELLKNKALGSLMSGSGSTVFGIFEDEGRAQTALEKLREKYGEFLVFRTKTV